MNEFKITLGIKSTPKESGKILNGIDGVSVKVKPPVMAFDSGIDIERYMDFIVVIAVPAVKYVAEWLFDKLKEKEKSEVVINGNHVNGNNTTIIQIINIIEGKPKE